MTRLYGILMTLELAQYSYKYYVISIKHHPIIIDLDFSNFSPGAGLWKLPTINIKTIWPRLNKLMQQNYKNDSSYIIHMHYARSSDPRVTIINKRDEMFNFNEEIWDRLWKNYSYNVIKLYITCSTYTEARIAPQSTNSVLCISSNFWLLYRFLQPQFFKRKTSVLSFHTLLSLYNNYIY